MAVQFRGAVALLFAAAILVRAEDIFKDVNETKAYKLDDPSEYNVTAYHDGGYLKKMPSIVNPGCCCKNKIKELAEHNVEYIVGFHLSNAIDNTDITLSSLEKETELFKKKLIKNLKRFAQLKSNWKNAREGTLLQFNESLYNLEQKKAALCFSQTKDLAVTDEIVNEKLIFGGALP